MEGFGPVEREAAEPVFHAPWEGRVFGLANLALALGVANLDGFRHAIERLPPLTYLSVGYYGRWLRALELLLRERGLLAPGELEARLRDPRAPAAPLASRPLPPAELGAKRPRLREPRFAAGEAVRAANRHPHGHTRLPRYARGRRGTIALVHPEAWLLPDAHAHGDGEHPEPVYAVRFAARELWGEDADPAAWVHLDCFESYLEPLDASRATGGSHGAR